MIQNPFSFFLILNHIKSSIKPIILSSIGLILALAIISSSSIYIESQSTLFLQKEVKEISDNFPRTYDLEFSSSFSAYNLEEKIINLDSLVQEFETNLFSKLEDYQLKEHFSYTSRLYGDFTEIRSNGTIVNEPEFFKINILERVGFKIYQLNLDHFDQLRINFNFYSENLTNRNDIIFIGQPDESIQLNSALFLQDQNEGDFYRSLTNLTVKKIITFEEIIKYDLDDDLFPVNKGFDFHLNYAFTRNLTTLFETINNSRLINENHVNFAFNLYPLLENANKAIVENVVFSSELVKDELEINFQNLYFQYQVDLGHYYFDNDVTHSFKDALTTQNQILNNMIGYALPLFLLIIFISNFAFNLLYRPIQTKFNIYRKKGASNTVIFVLQLTELFTINIISILIAFILSFPLVIIGFQTTESLSISFGIFPDFKINIIQIFLNLIYLSIFLSTIITVPRIIRTAQITLQETSVSQEDDEPFWKRHFIDIYLTIIPLSIILIFIFLDEIIPEFSSISLLTNFLLPFPLLLSVGSILLITRIIPIIFLKLSNFFWKKSFFVISLEFQHLLQIKKTFLHGFMLLTFLSVLLILFTSLPLTEEQSLINNQYERDGFDAVSYTNQFNESLSLEIEEKYQLDIKAITPFFRVAGQNNYNQHFQLLIINSSEFADVLPESSDSSQFSNFNDFSSNLKQLGENVNNKTNILMLSTSAEVFKFNINDTINFQFIFPVNTNYTIIDTFSKWPGFISRFHSYGNYYVIILDLNIAQNLLNESIDSFSFEKGYYINFNSNSYEKQNEIILELENFYPELSVESVSESVYNHRNSPNSISIWGETLIIIFVIIVAIFLVTYLFMESYLTELKIILSIERALGKSQTQIMLGLFFGICLLLISSISFGFIFGSGISLLYNFINNMQSFSSLDLVIPFHWLIPIYLILLTTLIFLFAFIIRVWTKKSIIAQMEVD
ncbi:MAG: hypothetical protein HeimC3_49400 [Candidatus Heimdallarchaeota archaeon LC_3]|nr:MAG: hypothetical protein HeimC3_49400 [Candidatus Heimdallarchaeota archaeon LC_3]